MGARNRGAGQQMNGRLYGKLVESTSGKASRVCFCSIITKQIGFCYQTKKRNGDWRYAYQEPMVNSALKMFLFLAN